MLPIPGERLSILKSPQPTDGKWNQPSTQKLTTYVVLAGYDRGITTMGLFCRRGERAAQRDNRVVAQLVFNDRLFVFLAFGTFGDRHRPQLPGRVTIIYPDDPMPNYTLLVPRSRHVPRLP